jgi:heat shock protein HslJ
LDQEAALFEGLQAIAAYQASEEALVFRAADGETIMTFARKVPLPVDPALADSGWVLVALRGENLLEGSHISLSFDQEGAGGYSGCNRYGGQYKVADEGSLRLSEIPVTAMECDTPEGVMDQELVYLEALCAVESYELADGRMVLRDGEGQKVLVYDRQQETSGDPAELVGTAWRLVSLDSEAPLEGSTLTLAFRDERRASGHAGCRDYFLTYEAEGGELNFLSTGMMGTECAPGRLGGEEALMRQEGAYTTILGWTDRYQLLGDRLELLAIRGEALVYERLRALSLEGPTWSLLGFVEPSPDADTDDSLPPLPTEVLPGTEITAIFGEGKLEGSAGCNHYGAMVKREGPSLRVGDLYFTEMACPEPVGVMEQEQRYLSWLVDITTVAIQGHQLWLETGDGRALVFTVQE